MESTGYDTSDGYEGSIPSDCFTWKINKELEVELICKLSGANTNVNIYDSRNRYNFNCSYDKTCQAHSNERHETSFTVAVADDYEGQWFCKHGKNRLSANISISNGYLPSTQLTLSVTLHEDKSYALSCSTCWEIDGLSVEFLVNSKTNDSLRFKDKKCYHSNRECVESRCSCSPNSFNWTFKADDRSKIHNFSCKIHFKDSERTCDKEQTITLMVDRQGR
ncbi:Hypothetical predicted protein [Mytilus galloprovincialis]|uniref:Uncharacterized protein n=1 Tax=Mytilus galloprovincialis TaxID=29158 RepID=A0A8B6GPM9_MYTGA|nr:Hypothetical predicted protein [Mytilus galloprovincialis]